MGDTPTVSIIVPVYKVEKYIRKCVDSILAQTLHDIEIILVDDGSPDNCPQICDEYAKLDDRIKVIHKKNGGLSDARNKGVEAAKGKYIGFVDSDDYIAQDMYETLYNLAQSYHADVSVCKAVIVAENENAVFSSSEIVNVMEKETALAEMVCKRKFTVNAWNKLYKKELFDEIKYPKGILYEDLATTYRIINKSKYIVYTPAEKYAYVQRQGSIMNSTGYFVSKDKVAIVNDMVKCLCNKDDNEFFAGIMRYLLNDIYKMAAKGNLVQNVAYMKELNKFLKGKKHRICINKYLTAKEKAVFLLTRFCPLLLQNIYSG